MIKSRNYIIFRNYSCKIYLKIINNDATEKYERKINIITFQNF